MRANRYTYLLLLLTGICPGAQLLGQGICSSSALAPVFSQTFGTSPSSTTKTTVPSGFTTNYAFNGSSQLADGQYMVTPLVQNSGKADWALGGDHTGDANGNMFLVNAGTGGSVFFQQQVNNLCPGSTYSFSAWMVNVNTQSLTLPICTSSYVYPNVTFNIKNTNGVILQSYNTGNLPFTADRNSAPNWRQYGFQFSLPSGTTSLILEMVDSYGGQPQCGNDLAIDDIVFSACTPQATIAFTTSSALCAGSNTEMDVSLVNSAFLAPAYQWQKSTNGGVTWSNIGTAGTTAIAFPLNNLTVADGGQYRVLVGPDVSSLSSNTCVTASNALTLTVHDLPSANISANSPLCAGGMLNLQANVSGGLSPYSYNWAGPSFTSTLSSPVISNLSATVQSGGYALTVTDANQCTVSTSVQLSVLSSATQAQAGTAQTVCGAAAQLAGNASVIGTGQWTQTSGPAQAVFADATQGNTMVTGLVPGVYEFTWTISNGACTGTSDVVTVTVLAPAVPGTLSSDASVCSGINNGVLALTGSSGTIVQWESSTDGVNWTPVPNSQPSYMYNNLTATTSFRVLLQNGTCAPMYSNTVTITVNQPPTPGTVSADATVCSSSNQGTLTLTGGGAVIQWESSTDGGMSWNAIVNTTSSLTYSNLAATTLFRALSGGGVCPSVYSNNAAITVNPASASGTLSGDATVCAAVNAGAITVTGYTGNVTGWEYTMDGGQSWSPITSGNDTYGYNNLSATTGFRAIVQNGVCAAVRTNMVSITVQQAAVGGVLLSDAVVCAMANNGTISLTGMTGSVLNWESSTDGGQTWNTINSTSTSLTYNNLSASTSYRANVHNGACAASRSNQVNITVQQPTVAGTLAGDATVCASSNSGTISLTGITGSVSNWESSTDGGQTWNTINSTATSFSYSNLSTSTSYRANVQNGACAASRSNQVNITVQQATVSGTLTGDATVCASSNSGTISLTGMTGSVLNWESSTDGGQTWNTINSTATSFNYSNLSTPTSYRANVQNGTCAASRSNQVNITVQQPTVAGTLAGDATVCASSNSGTISLTGITGSVLNWESSTDGGQTWNAINSTATSFSYNNLSASTSYRANVQNGACAASRSNQVNITVQQPTVAGTLTGDVTVCASSNSGTISLTGITGAVLNWESSTDGGQNWNAINSTATSFSYSNLSTSTSYRANVQNGACAALRSNQVNITVQQPTVAGTLSGDATVCALSNSGTISLTGMTGSVLNWESSTDGGQTWNTINSTATSFSYTNISSSTSYRANVQNGTCVASRSNSVNVTVQQPTVAGTLAGDATVCASSNSGTISLTGITGSVLNWESSTDGGQTWNTINSNTTSVTYNNLLSSTSFRVNVQNGACAASKSNTVNITVQQPTVPGTITGDATVCASSNSGTVSLTGMTGSVLNWEFSTDGGQTWTNISSNAASLSYDHLAVTTSYRAKVQNAVCAAATSGPVTVTVRPAPSPANAGPDMALCNAASLTLNANQPFNGAGSWRVIAGPGNVSLGSSGTQGFVTNMQPGTYIFAFNVSSAGCPSSEDTMLVTNHGPVLNTIDSGNLLSCKGQALTIHANNIAGASYLWQKSIDDVNWENAGNAISATAYTVTADTTSYIRRIATLGSCSATSNTVKIVVNTPVTDNLVAGNQQVCAGSLAQPVKGNLPPGGDGNFSFRWEQSTDSGASWSGIAGAIAQNLQLADTLNATRLIRRIVSTAGCTGTLANTSTPVILSVVPIPSVSLQYKGGVYCDRSIPVEFAVASTHADTLHWNFGDGSTETTSSNKIAHSFSRPGNFLPTVRASNAAGCQAAFTASDTIRIDELNIGFKLAAAYNCGQTSYQFADTSVSYSPIVERLWTIGQQTLGTDPTVKQIFRAAGDYETGLALRNQNGCARSLQAKFSVSIFNYPDVNIDAIGQTCLNNLLELKSVINSTDSVTNRLWNLGNGSNASDSVVKVQYYSEGKYIVKLMVATVNNCLDSAVKQINVYSLPQISVVKNQTVCKGDSVELKAAGASYYIWKDDRDSVLCSNCLTAKVKPSANATYKVIGYSKYGCTNIGATSVSLIQPFKMEVRSVDSVCLGASKNLFASGAASYSWAPDASLHGNNSASPSVTPTQTTTYHVTGADSYHCFTDTASVKVVVGSPTLISAGADTMVLSGAPVQLHASSALQNIRNWQWKGNATFSCLNCPAPAATVIMDECLTCSATNVFGCTSTDTICITTFCPGSEVFVPNAFSPDGDGINDILFVQGRGIKAIKSFRVYSRWGELVFEKTNFQPGDKSAGWDGRVRGKAASPDVFVYICEAICEKGIPAIFKGNTAIIK